MLMVFLTVTFISVFLLATLVLGNTRRGLLAASGVLLFMLLNYYRAGNYLTALLIAGILLSIEYYFSRQ